MPFFLSKKQLGRDNQTATEMIFLTANFTQLGGNLLKITENPVSTDILSCQTDVDHVTSSLRDVTIIQVFGYSWKEEYEYLQYTSGYVIIALKWRVISDFEYIN